MTEKNQKHHDNAHQNIAVENSLTRASSKLKKFFFKYSKKTFCSKTLSAIFFLIIGIIVTNIFQTLKHNYEASIIKKHFNNFYHDFDNDYIGLDNEDNDFRKELFRMQKPMDRAINYHSQFFDQNNFPNNFQQFKRKIRNSGNVKLHEDDKNFYYELVFFGFSKDEISVEIKDNILTFQAIKKIIESNFTNDKTTEEVKQQNNSSFNYSFLLNNYNNEKPADITKLDDKIIVKIAKK
jgi:HSP20 family molecular chaperone IbpA